MLMQQPVGRGQVQMFLSYPPTDPQAVCFNDWRPLGVKPGDKWRTEAMLRGLGPVFLAALTGAKDIPPQLVTAITACLADSDVAVAAFGAPPDAQKN